MGRVVLLLLCGSLFGSAAAQAKPLNVLFIVCDDLNTHVSTSGYRYTKTPNFDRLAAAGMTFDRAYCQYPVCGPSRASFLSGLYPESTGVLSNTADIRETRPGAVLLPKLFHRAGYWTAGVGKVFHGPNYNPKGDGWDDYARFNNDEMPIERKAREAFEAEHGPIGRGPARKKWREYYPTIAPQTRNQNVGYGRSGLTDSQHKDGKNARQIAAWLDDGAHGDKPFFMACGIQKPHVPFLAPDAYFDLYPRSGLTFKPADPAFWDQAPPIAMTGRYKGFGFELGVEDDALRRKYMQAYHACISFIDAQIGLVFDALERNGHWDDTVVVLTSDHGYLLGEKFMWGKVMLFEQCDRVPLVIRAPGVTRDGSRTQALVELVDLYPTLSKLAGIDAPPGLQGRSLAPLLRGATDEGKQAAYTVVSRGPRLGRAVRTKRWRYTEWPRGEELYDLKNDPDEETNLAGSSEQAETLARMRSLLAQARDTAESPGRAQRPGRGQVGL